jgi:hypothetical protein
VGDDVGVEVALLVAVWVGEKVKVEVQGVPWLFMQTVLVSVGPGPVGLEGLLLFEEQFVSAIVKTITGRNPSIPNFRIAFIEFPP